MSGSAQGAVEPTTWRIRDADIKAGDRKQHAIDNPIHAKHPFIFTADADRGPSKH